jgi:hypothetical protein
MTTMSTSMISSPPKERARFVKENFLIAADLCIDRAAYTGPVDEEVRQAVRQVLLAWNDLAQKIEAPNADNANSKRPAELRRAAAIQTAEDPPPVKPGTLAPPSDDGLDIPEQFDRRIKH